MVLVALGASFLGTISTTNAITLRVLTTISKRINKIKPEISPILFDLKDKINNFLKLSS